MPWFKVDDALYGHPKWLRCSPAARALWVTAGSWCAAQLTDGHIPTHVLPTLSGTTKAASELVQVGLWTTAEDGWQFHAWLEFQPSAEQVEADRAAARERQRRARDKARESRSSHAVTHSEVTPVVTAPPTRPDPTIDTTPPSPPVRKRRRTPTEPPNPSSLIPPVAVVLADRPDPDPEANRAGVAFLRSTHLGESNHAATGDIVVSSSPLLSSEVAG